MLFSIKALLVKVDDQAHVTQVNVVLWDGGEVWHSQQGQGHQEHQRHHLCQQHPVEQPQGYHKAYRIQNGLPFY